jgi:quinolinate synthase
VSYISKNKEIAERILALKKSKNAILLVHNYQRPEIQDVADFLGDSLGLSLQASKTDAEVIVFCGVDFMAESAKILNPDKIVIHPNPKAKCPMAAMISVKELQAMKKENPSAAVVAYVNTTAETKAKVDVCCTSANAVKVIKSLPQKKIIFIPDINLGLYVQRFAPEKEFVFWNGYCHVHQGITKEEILGLKKQHPNAEILVHPECIPEVIDVADFVYSTEGMVRHVSNSSSNEFIIGTEKEMCYRLKKENPSKKFYPVKSAICPNMKRITIEDVLKSLEALKPKITLPDNIMKAARLPLQRMMDIGRGD